MTPDAAIPPDGIRPDSALRRLDVAAAVGRDLAAGPDRLAGPDRQAISADAAIAAALAAEELRVGAFPLGFLARYIRTAGLAKALVLPEPLIRPDQAELVRDWMRAAAAADPGPDRDDVFARWLEMVAAVLALRRNARLATNHPGSDR